MSVYEHWADKSGYIYFKKQGQPSLPGMIHEIACRPNFHKAVEFIVLTEGEQRAHINGRSWQARAGDILFVDSLLPHSYPPADGVDGYILVLSDWYLQFFHALYDDRSWPPLLDHREANAPIIEYIKFWYSHQDGDPYEKFNRANEFFAMLVRAYPPQHIRREKTDEIIVNMLTFIEENYTSNITMEMIADKLGYAKQYCSKLFNRMVDESFRKYLNRVRVLKFEELWRVNSGPNKKTVLELAFACGFDSQTTFYRAYREVNGRPPKLEGSRLSLQKNGSKTGRGDA